MKTQGPTAPITKYVLVRNPRPVSDEKRSLNFISRPEGPTDLWRQLTDLTRAGTSEQVVQACNQFADANPLSLGTLPDQYSSLRAPETQLDEIEALLRASGPTSAIADIRRRQLNAYFAADLVQQTRSLILTFWDQIAVRTIVRSDPDGLRALFSALKVLHLARYVNSLANDSVVSATPFNAQVLMPADILTFVGKSTADRTNQIKSNRNEFNQGRTAAVGRQFTDAVLAHAVHQIVIAAIKSNNIRLLNPPAPASSEHAGVDLSITRLNARDTKIVLDPSALSRIRPQIADFLRDQLLVPDLATADVVSLERRINQELVSRTNGIFAFASAEVGAQGTRHLRFLAKEYNAGRIPDLDAAVRAAAQRFPLGAASVTLRGELPPTPGNIRPAGIADLKTVNQQLQRYQLGEVAYIENVLAGEERERTHNRLERTEQQLVVETEETKETERDLQTTERFELAQEMSSMQKESRSTDVGINISASYGPVTLAAHAGEQDSASAETAIKNARNNMKETVERAVERVQTRTRRQETITITTETSETNKHRFASTGTSIVGVYRYVEKYYWCQTLNYGSRLMLEFLIPEPAAFYLYTQTPGVQPTNGLTPPDQPKFAANDIDDTTYFTFAAKYKAKVTDPPKLYQYQQLSYSTKRTTEGDSPKSETIEDNYEVIALTASYEYIYTRGAIPPPDLGMFVGGQLWSSTNGWPFFASINPGIEKTLTVQLMPFNISGNYVVGITLLLQRTKEVFERWQLATFNAIMDGYAQLKDEYDRAVASQKADRPSMTAKSDAEYRAIETRELKRAALELLTDQHFDSFGAIDMINDFPTIDNTAALSEGPIVEFFEHAFEWNETTYTFYPYFWGRKSEWVKSVSLGDADPVFAKFLAAGYARVVVPVRKSFEADIYYYLQTGVIWHGGSTPDTDDPEYVSIITEIREMDADLERGNQDGVPEGNPWQISVPTSLVCLDSDTIKLPSWDIAPAGKPLPYVPSESTCDGIPYNSAQWPDKRAAALGLRALGYGVPDVADYDIYFATSAASRMVRAFQRRANEVGISAALGRPLRIDGIVGPCTLRALTVTTEMLLKNEWPGPDLT